MTSKKVYIVVVNDEIMEVFLSDLQARIIASEKYKIYKIVEREISI